MIKSLTHLSVLAQVSVDEIHDIIKYPHNYYEYFEKPKKDYVTGEKKITLDGSVQFRPIHPTKPGSLKIIQRKLSRILSNHKLPPNVHGGVKGKSNITNALAHLGYNYHFVTDLEGFFPSIEQPRVVEMFMRLGYTRSMSKHLARLSTFCCTPIYEGSVASVPQGSPTSTVISNLVLTPLDKQLANFCSVHNIIYTRYIDDMTFSSNMPFQKLTQEIINMIIAYGLKINHNKTYYSLGPVEITGAKVFLNRLDLTNKQREKILYLIAHPEDPRAKNLSKVEDYKAALKQAAKNRSTPTV